MVADAEGAVLSAPRPPGKKCNPPESYHRQENQGNISRDADSPRRPLAKGRACGTGAGMDRRRFLKAAAAVPAVAIVGRAAGELQASRPIPTVESVDRYVQGTNTICLGAGWYRVSSEVRPGETFAVYTRRSDVHIPRLACS